MERSCVAAQTVAHYLSKKKKKQPPTLNLHLFSFSQLTLAFERNAIRGQYYKYKYDTMIYEAQERAHTHTPVYPP